MPTRHQNNYDNHVYSPTLMLLVLFAAIGALLYGSFILDPANRGDLIAYLFVVTAEVFIIFQALVALWTILAGTHNPRSFEFHNAQQHLFTKNHQPLRYKSIVADPAITPHSYPLHIHHHRVSVDVFVTVYGEPLETISDTVVAARDMIGQHNTYILDDGKSDEVKNLARTLGVEYIRRPTNEGAKAGNINHALTQTSGDYFVIFDADFVAKPNFLYETIPFFEDERIAFVQTPQCYRNAKNMIARGADYMQLVFYRLIQTGKNRFNAAFCVGTNVVFRRSAIKEIGGMYQKSKSEDIWTSILLHEHGYKSIYIPDQLAIGSTPETIKAYSKQQLRWATGGFQIFFKHNPLTKNLTIDQKLQYFSTSAYYFHGIAIMLLMLLPPLHIFFNLTPVNLTIGIGSWFVFYAGFYVMQIIVAFYTMGGFRWQTLALAMVSFPIYIRALINALRGKEEAWQATNRKDGTDSPFNYIMPQIFIFLFLAFTSAVGIWKTFYYETLSIALFWCLINTFVFGSFLYFATKEHMAMKRPDNTPRLTKVISLTKLRGEKVQA